MQKAARIIDKILFNMVPGFCFLTFFWRMFDALDTYYRAQNSSGMLVLLSLALIVFSANIIIWIFLDEVILGTQSSEKNPPNRAAQLLKNLVFFLITFGAVFAANPGTGLYVVYGNFVQSGALYYGAVMIGDMLHIVKQIKRDVITTQKMSTRFGWLALGVYFVFLLAVVVFTLAKVLDFSGTVTTQLLLILVPFVFSVINRFRQHAVYSKA